MLKYRDYSRCEKGLFKFIHSSLVWSICATVNEESRFRVDNFIREIEGTFPLRDTVYEYFVDSRLRMFVSWEERLPSIWKIPPKYSTFSSYLIFLSLLNNSSINKFYASTPFYKIVVPTVDTVRYEFVTSYLLRNQFPILLLGPVGTGKTSVVQLVLTALDEMKYSVLTLNMSAQTTSKNVQASKIFVSNNFRR